jgi:hypothetical protein
LTGRDVAAVGERLDAFEYRDADEVAALARLGDPGAADYTGTPTFDAHMPTQPTAATPTSARTSFVFFSLKM